MTGAVVGEKWEIGSALFEVSEVRVAERPDHALTIGDVFRIFTRDRTQAGSLLEAPEMSVPWREWAERQV